MKVFPASEFYCPPEEVLAVEAARALYGHFNIIHYKTGFKIDLIVRKGRPFSREEFRRRIPSLFGELQCWFASPEDTILAKLEWSKLGESERQYADAVYIARVHKNLDIDYLRKWASDLGVDDLLTRLFRELQS